MTYEYEVGARERGTRAYYIDSKSLLDQDRLDASLIAIVIFFFFHFSFALHRPRTNTRAISIVTIAINNGLSISEPCALVGE